MTIAMGVQLERVQVAVEKSPKSAHFAKQFPCFCVTELIATFAAVLLTLKNDPDRYYHHWCRSRWTIHRFRSRTLEIALPLD
jgi:hypothetical protein